MKIEKVNKIFFADEKLFKLHNHVTLRTIVSTLKTKGKFQMMDLLVKRSISPKNVMISAVSFEAVVRNTASYAMLVSQW